MDFLFLPPIYFLTLIISGFIMGFTFDYINQRPFIVASGVLFGVFTVSQFVYRVFENAQPERLIGQLVYYLIFLSVVYISRVIKNKIDWWMAKR